MVGHNFPSKEQASFNFMAAITICSDFGTPPIKSVTVSTVSPTDSSNLENIKEFIMIQYKIDI